MSMNDCVVLENERFRLVLSPDGRAESLCLKSNGTQCLANSETPFCSITEDRPYNNEVKLAHPTKQTIFPSNRIRMENGNLVVGFEQIGFEAVIRVDVRERYMVFALVDFIVKPDSFGVGVLPIQPPVREIRLVQLPVAHRERFGEWLNVLWDEQAAVNVLAACPYTKVGAEQRSDHRILFGEALSEVQLKNVGVALVVSEPEGLLDGIEALEEDLDLPRGVASRRSKQINHSYHWVSAINPDNVDEYIAYAKKGGFRYLLLFYWAFLDAAPRHTKTGVYDNYRPEYKNGREDLIAVLEKIKAAGISPGLHLLHSHVGLHSPYLTPVADHRVNLTKHFTLAKPVGVEDTTIYVEENPEGAPVFKGMRVLRFMGELIQYESYTVQRPYCFTGCKRGFNDTIVRAHEIGTIGGILDISEFQASSAYINQNTSLQDEIACKIAEVYDAGFEFLYFDGSEGVNAPFDIHVGLAQWRVYSKLKKKPIFCEGAAKSNFSWHMLSGGNAFDVWPADVFKEMIVKHPFREAERMENDFTRVNFGWWPHRGDMRPDHIEYATSLAAAWDCPGALQANRKPLAEIPRTDDILETLRRWEEARACGFITPEIKAELKRTEIEHTLLINEDGEFELAAWEQVKDAFGGDDTVTVFLLERKGKCYAVCWNNLGCGHISLPLGQETICYVERLGGEEVTVERNGTELILPVDKKRYLISDISKERLTRAFADAKLL